jgi:hypothetical protein
LQRLTLTIIFLAEQSCKLRDFSSRQSGNILAALNTFPVLSNLRDRNDKEREFFVSAERQALL